MFDIGSNAIVVTNLVPLVGEQKKGAKLFVSHSGLQIMFAYESFMCSAHAWEARQGLWCVTTASIEEEKDLNCLATIQVTHRGFSCERETSQLF